MPKVEINRVRKLGNPVHANDWRLEFTRLPDAVQRIAGLRPGDQIDPFAVNLDFPRMQVQTTELVHRGLSINLPSPVEFDKQVSITFLETESKPILKMFEVWRAMASKIALPYSYSPDGTYESLKGAMRLSQLSRKGEVLFTINFEGVFVVSLDLGQASEAKGADILRPVVGFSYDYFYFDEVK